MLCPDVNRYLKGASLEHGELSVSKVVARKRREWMR
jgi:hypothetical protein